VTSDKRHVPAKHAQLPPLGRVCRLGLATRGNTKLSPDAVLEAVERGVNYLNWCTHPDGMSRAVRQMGDARSRVFVAAQFYAHSAKEAKKELKEYLGELGTGYIDVLTYYYLEHESEWDEILSSDGAQGVLDEARQEGKVRAIGVTSHQRKFAADLARSGRVDLLMIRYNAAHRGAQKEIFPVTTKHRLPVVVYTGVRWGALMKSTPDDPPGFRPPTAPDCYRFQLMHRGVTVALMAPDGEQELEEDLSILDHWKGLGKKEYEALCRHGDRVRKHAGTFP